MDDDALQVRASALSAEAMSRIAAELGPRALPMHKDTYLAAACEIVKDVFSGRWDVDVTMDMTGAVHIFPQQYHG